MLYSGKYVVVVSIGCLLVGLFSGYFFVTNAVSGSNNNNNLNINEEKANEFNRGFLEGNDSGYHYGYNIGYDAGVNAGVGSGFNIRDPTYVEMIGFIASDKTELHQYNAVSYNCFHFCRDFLDNAFASGFKAGFVYVEFPDGAHGMICFDTVDKGLVYVEPQSDDIISLRVGYEYDFIEEPNEVTGFTVIW